MSSCGDQINLVGLDDVAQSGEDLPFTENFLMHHVVHPCLRSVFAIPFGGIALLWHWFRELSQAERKGILWGLCGEGAAWQRKG